MRPFAFALPPLALLGGCATLGTFQGAETLGKGGWEVGIEPSMWAGVSSEGSLLYPHAAVSSRVGLGDRFDIGGRLGSSGVELTTKVALSEPGADVPIAIAPSFGGMAVSVGTSSASVLALHVPVLFGIRTGENELVLGPKVHLYSFGASAGGGASGGALWSAGGSVGYLARLGPTVGLVPELAFAVPLFATGAEGAESAVGLGKGALVQVGMGILIGRSANSR
jgi:hypothetical protein